VQSGFYAHVRMCAHGCASLTHFLPWMCTFFSKQKSSGHWVSRRRKWVVPALLAAAGAAVAFHMVPAFQAWCIHAADAANAWLRQLPGFLESLSLVFLSELGDKTFFIAALLAMRLGKAISFFGSVSALGVMTVVSVGLGRAFAQVPQFVNSSLPIQQWVGAALLAYFGAVPPWSFVDDSPACDSRDCNV
jgi:Uncharacterized protein family UPF0016